MPLCHATPLSRKHTLVLTTGSCLTLSLQSWLQILQNAAGSTGVQQVFHSLWQLSIFSWIIEVGCNLCASLHLHYRKISHIDSDSMGYLP